MAAEQINIVIRAQNEAAQQINQVNDQLNQVGNTATVTTSRLSQLTARINNFGVRATPATAGAAGLNQAFTATNRSVTALRQGVVVLGASAFPRLTGSILFASQGLQSFNDFARLSNLTILGFAARAVPAIAGIAAVIATATAAWGAYKAAQKEALSEEALAEQRATQFKGLTETLKQLRDEGRFTEQEFKSKSFRLNFAQGDLLGPGALNEISRAVRARVLGVEDALEAIKKLIALNDELHLKNLEGEEKARAEARRTFEQRLAQIDEERAKIDATQGLNPEEQTRARAALRIAELNAVKEHDRAIAAIDEAERAREQQAIQQQSQAEAQRVGAELRGLQEVEDLRQRMRIAALTGTEREVAEINDRYDREIQRIQELVEELRLSGQAELDLINQINAARDVAIKEATTSQTTKSPFQLWKEDLEDLDRQQGAIFGALNAEISGVARGITEAAFVTGDWRNAFSNLGLTAVNTLVEIGLQMAIQSTLASVLRKRSVAEAAVEGPSIAAAYTPAAATAGAATFGANAIGATIVVAAILAAIAALAGAFEKGGYTGGGGKNDIAGVVHGGEFVFSKKAVDNIGVRELEAIHAGAKGERSLPELDRRLRIPAFQGGGPVPVPSHAGVSEINVGLIEDRQDLRRWQARRNFKQVAAELARHGNRVNV